MDTDSGIVNKRSYFVHQVFFLLFARQIHKNTKQKQKRRKQHGNVFVFFWQDNNQLYSSLACRRRVREQGMKEKQGGLSTVGCQQPRIISRISSEKPPHLSDPQRAAPL